jgi:pyruvate/2-oxoglutarate dehydrogenase complex dihydrolipoamide dehydrogenase (E3) component
MAVDYDLVVIGNSAAGIEAAIAAAHVKARVALVEQGCSPDADSGATNVQVLQAIGRSVHQTQRLHQMGMGSCADGSEIQPAATCWQSASRWNQVATATLAELKSAAVVSALGVEMIPGRGEFYRKPAIGFVVNGRQLRSRAYLLAIPPRPLIPAIDGLAATRYLTPETLLQQPDHLEQVRSLVIIGNTATAIELAQTLLRLGLTVTLVANHAQLLPLEDPEATRLIQAQLEADGVRVLTQMPVTQVRSIQGKKWVQAGNQAIEADEILLCAGQQPHLDDLNLDAAAVRWRENGLLLNDKLQTTHPKIYACLGTIDHNYAPQIAIYQAQIAVNNVLFLPTHRANYASVPRLVQTQPELASLGLTEPQATQCYGKDLLIVRQFHKSLPKAQIQGEITGFCKLITQRNGTILGAHLVGAEASELISPIALAMQQHLKLSVLAKQIYPLPTLGEIVQQTAIEWQRLKLAQNHRLQDFWEGWFGLRRSWS